jgi:hypothetical protein
MTVHNEKITVNQIILTAFGALISVIVYLGVLQLTEIKDAIKEIKTFMVDQKVENEKKNGVIESLKEKDVDLQKQNDDLKKQFDDYRRVHK